MIEFFDWRVYMIVIMAAQFHKSWITPDWGYEWANNIFILESQEDFNDADEIYILSKKNNIVFYIASPLEE